MIVFLNGASSSGKSTIARQIMHQSERPFLYYSVNHLVEYWIDEKFVAFDDAPKGWFYHQFEADPSGNPTSRYAAGPDIQQLHWDMIEALQVLIKKGYDLIIDEILWQSSIFEHYLEALRQADKVYLVKINCDLIECERREQKRKDRFKGLARGSYSEVYGPYPLYDLEVDTTTKSAAECAQTILQFIHHHPKPEAFTLSLTSQIKLKSP